MSTYYTIDEVAAEFKVARNTVKRMIERKQILAIQMGAQYRIPAAEWERMHREGVLLDALPAVAVRRDTVRAGGRGSRR